MFDPARLEAYLESAGLSFRRTSRSFVLTCPLCGKDDKLYIFKHSGRFVCWVCKEDKNFHGAPEFALKELTGRPIARIRQDLYGLDAAAPATDFLNLDFGELLDETDTIEPDPLPDLEWPYHCYPITDSSAALGLKYLEGRGISVELALEYDVRYSTKRRSVAFPVYVGTRLVGWQYRTIDPTSILMPDNTVQERLKVISDSGDCDFPRERCVMFQNRLVGSHAVVCEGPIDALKAHLVGGNVATMGKAVGAKQVELLLNAGITKVYLALDPDAASELEPLFQKFEDVKVYVVSVPAPFKDLGMMSLEAARDAILGAREFVPQRDLDLQLYFKDEHLVLPHRT